MESIAGLVSSKLWMLLIIAFGLFTGVANYCYQISSDSEKKEDAKNQLLTSLRKELNDNLTRAHNKKALIEANPPQINRESLQTGVWQAISAGGLLVQAGDTALLNQLVEIYQLIHLSNSLETKLFELNEGIASTLSRAPEHRIQIIQAYKDALDKVVNKISDFNTKKVN